MEADKDTYEPYDHRNLDGAMKNWEARINMILCTFGTGCLAMPIAFSHIGYINALFSIILITAIITYALHIMLYSMYALCKRYKTPLLTYRKAMEISFTDGPVKNVWMAKTAGYLVDGFLFLYHFGICTVYVIFIADNIKIIFDHNDLYMDLRIYIVILLIPLAIVFSVRDLKRLVPLSIIANVLLTIGFLVVIGTVVINLPSLSERSAFKTLELYPLYLGIVLFAMEAIGVILSIESEMKTPKDFLGFFGIMNQGLFIALTLYAIMGFFGYWQYGEEVKGTVSVNLPDTVYYKVVNVMFAIAIYFCYPLQGYVTVYVLWHHTMSKKVIEERRILYEHVFRVCVAIASVAVALAFPEVGSFLALVGSFCLSLLGLIFPAILHLSTRYEEGYGFLKMYLILDIIIIIIGILCGISGTYSSIKYRLAA